MKVKDLKNIIKDLDDDVELYYPHYYKGYGLIPVESLDVGEVDCKTVGVFDSNTLLLGDINFVNNSDETILNIAEKLRNKRLKISSGEDDQPIYFNS